MIFFKIFDYAIIRMVKFIFFLAAESNSKYWILNKAAQCTLYISTELLKIILISA